MTKRLPQAFRAMAVADAIGNEFEFLRPSPEEVTLAIRQERQLVITDDTQMSLFGLEGINKAENGEYASAVCQEYLNWYETQNLRRPLKGSTGLAAEPQMYSVQAPGNTCLTSLRKHKVKSWSPNGSNGCGTVMRLLPFAGLIEKLPFHQVKKIALECSEFTHNGDEIEESTYEYLELAAELIQAGEYASLRYRPVTYWGEGWTAQSCFMMAFQALSNAKSFEDLLVQSIAHAGDSDSVAAVAAGLWGLAGGSVPDRLVARVKEMPVVDRVTSTYMEKYYGQR